MNEQLVIDRRLQELDDLGIVTERRENRRKMAQIDRRVSIEMSAPEIRAAVRRAVNAGLKAEVERVIAARRSEDAKEIIALQPHGPPLKLILDAVAEVTGVSVVDLCGPRQARGVTRPRHLGFYLVKRLRPDLSLPKIGNAFGGRDHTTIMHGVKKVETLADRPPFSEWLVHPSIHDLLAWKAPE